MTDVERKIAGPLSDKIPIEDDDWEPVPLSPSEELKLRLRVDSDAIEDVVDVIEDLGGTVGGNYGKTIHARIQAERILELAENESVTLIHEEVGYQAFDKRTVSEGVEISNIDDLHTDDVTGNGSKIAIIDFQFDPDNPKYGDNVVAEIGDSSGFVNEDELHGTGCAEVVYDMAPEADLVLCSIEEDSIFSILDKIENQHPNTDVVSVSLGAPPADRLDGKDSESLRFADFTDEGRIAAISAGNQADGNTWYGPYRDTGGEEDIMEFDDQGTEYLKVENPTFSSYIFANWDSWDDDDQDYILRVWEDENKTSLIGEDGPNPEPFAFVQFTSSLNEAYIEIENVGADGEQEFDIWTWFGGTDMQFPEHTRERSMSIPSTAQDPDTLAVAAVQATDKGAEWNAEDLKVYSSQGPTRDGRKGIDIAAPSRVSQTDNGYGSLDDWDPGTGVITGFNGTSAAAPHVAGAAGALFEADNVTNDEIRHALLETGVGIDDGDVSDPPNTKIGDGYLDAKAAYDTLTVDETTLSVSDNTIGFDETAYIEIDATLVDDVTVEYLWIDWDVDAVEGDGADTENNVETEGTYTFSWNSTKDVADLVLSIAPNGDDENGGSSSSDSEKYVGGKFLLTVTADGPETTIEDTAELELLYI